MSLTRGGLGFTLEKLSSRKVDVMGNVQPEPERPAGGQQPDWGQMKDKLTSVTGADRMILIAGLVFFIDSFLPWYGVSLFGVSVSENGWGTGGLAVLSILFAIAATAFAAMRVLGVKMDLPIKDGDLYLALGGGAFLFALLRWVTEMDFTKYGLYIAIIAGAVLAYGGWMKRSAKA